MRAGSGVIVEPQYVGTIFDGPEAIWVCLHRHALEDDATACAETEMARRTPATGQGEPS